MEMKKQIKKIGLFSLYFLIVLVTIAGVMAKDNLIDINVVVKDDIFKELKLNDAKNTNAILEIKNPMKNINIKREDIKVNFVEDCGYIKRDNKGNIKYEILVEDICVGINENKIYDTKEVCILNNKTGLKDNCYLEQYLKETIYENYNYVCYKEFEKINANDLKNFKIDVNCNDIVFDTCSDNSYGYKIDWQLEIILDDGINKKVFDKKEWAWWNDTFTERWHIPCLYMDDGAPIVINGSNGFEIDGKKQIVWTYCSGVGTSVYLHNSTDYSKYVIANDTTRLPMEVEFGNGTSYNSEDVWDDNYRFVQTMKDTNISAVIGSTSNKYIGTKTAVNEPMQVEGKIGKAQNFDGSDDKIDFGTNLFNNDIQGTISAWIRKDYGYFSYFFCAGGYTNEYFQFGVGYPALQIDKLSIMERNPESYGSGTTILQNQTWYYVVLTGDTIKWRIFINGVEDVITGGNSGDWISDVGGTVRYVIGSSYDSQNNYRAFFDGILDDVRVSNISRSDSYINQTYFNIIGTQGYGNIGGCSEDGDCEVCEKCVAYTCVNQADGVDLKNECFDAYISCLNDYTRQGGDGFCDGLGACDVDNSLLNVSVGNVCRNGDDINPDNITNCDVWIDCVVSENNASKYYVGYVGDGTNFCNLTDWVLTGTYWYAPEYNFINKTSIELLSCSYEPIPNIIFISPSEDNKSKFYSNELNNVKINFYDLNLRDYFIEFIYWENYLNQTIEFDYSNTNMTIYYYNFSEIFYTLKEGSWKINVTAIDYMNNTNNKMVLFEVIPLIEGKSIFDFDLTKQVNVILLFVVLFAYIGVMAIAFSFKNFGFASMGFIIGIFVGLLLSGLHIILTILFILVNILIFAKYASSFD